MSNVQKTLNGAALDGAALQEINGLRRNGAMPSPADIVAQARSSNSALHRYFTWDDSEAATAFRLQQAMTVIKAVVRVTASLVPPTRVTVRSGPAPAPAAIPLRSEAVTAEQAIRRLIGDIEALRARHPTQEAQRAIGDCCALLHGRLQQRPVMAPVTRPAAPKPGVVSPEDRLRARAVEIAAELGEGARKMIRLLPPDGSWKPTGPATSGLARALWDRYPDDDILTLGGPGSTEQVSLRPLGKLLRGVLQSA